MSPEAMRTRATEYQTEGDTVGAVITKMDSLLSTLQSEWEGAAADAYATRFEELRPNFVKAQELIYEIATALRTSAQTLEETDSNVAAGFGG
jgi:WXG100 family type VII secretion target